MTTWILVKEGLIDNVTEIAGDNLPDNINPWIKVPNRFGGVRDDKWPDWFDKDGRRIQNDVLVQQGKRIDDSGVWHHKKRTKPDVPVFNLDVLGPGDEYTLEPPLPDEPHQKFDEAKKKWMVDTEEKEKAEKEKAISEKQSAIDDAERRIQRSTRAKLAGTATAEDERFFTEINAEINQLREEKRQLLLSA